MLRVDGLSVAYGDQVVVRDLTLHAAAGEVLCVLGPSGCGKSTLLRAIAGLEPPTAGTIELDGRDLEGLRPDQRGVGLMFQEHALFPHRSVRDNVAFGPRMRGVPRDEQRRRVADALALMDLTGTEDRQVTELSGGERQRVALARAIAPRPRLLMLDEPLGSLDRALQTRLLDDLPAVFAELGTTVVYVTHDQHEALSLADRVAVMRAGRLQQVGTPDELWRGPRTAFVAGFLGLEHVVDVEVHDGLATTPWGEISLGQDAVGTLTDDGGTPREDRTTEGPDRGRRVEGRHPMVLLPDALRVTTVLRPLHVEEVRIAGTVVGRRFAGDHQRLRVRPRGGPELTVPIWRGEVPAVGRGIELALDPTRVRLLEPDGSPAASGGPAGPTAPPDPSLGAPDDRLSPEPTDGPVGTLGAVGTHHADRGVDQSDHVGDVDRAGEIDHGDRADHVDQRNRGDRGDEEVRGRREATGGEASRPSPPTAPRRGTTPPAARRAPSRRRRPDGPRWGRPSGR